MILCRVTGDVVSTVKTEKFKGQRLLMLQPVELDCRTPQGQAWLGLDRTHAAGAGDLVLAIKEGGGVRIVLEDKTIPLAVLVVAIVDDLDVVPDESALAGQSTLEHARTEAS